MKRAQLGIWWWVPSAAAVCALACGPAAAQQASGAAPAAGTSAPAARELVLAVKGQEVLPLSATPTRVAVADPQVADVKVLPPGAGRPGEVLVVGRKAGTTEVRIWTRGAREPQLWIARVVSDVQAALARRGVGVGAAVDAAGGYGVLTGTAPSADVHRGAVAAALAAAGDAGKVVDLSQIGTSGVVQVEVKVVELSRSVMKDIGLNFNADNGPWSGGVQLAPDLVAGGFFGLVSYQSRDFAASLQLLQTNGMARILAEPTLVALSGQSASFLAGGEIPVPESGGLGTQNVVYKPFGIGLTVAPTVISRDRIALKVAPEASELDYGNGISLHTSDGGVSVIPALRTRKADTTVELGDGESYIISGLVSRQTRASVHKIPLLGDLPVIGAFFRNIQYSQEDRELVIVVTPRLVRPIARGVSLPLPGGRQEAADGGFNAWGYYLLGPVAGQQMPGFSQ
ncbi:type II and III secretion system protein family protein [Bordetella sp. 2513F-2]